MIYIRIRLTRIPDRRLKHENGVIGQEVGDDESALLIDGFARLHTTEEAQDVTVQPAPVLLHEFDEVALGRFGDESHARAQGILLATEPVVGREFAGSAGGEHLFVVLLLEVGCENRKTEFFIDRYN